LSPKWKGKIQIQKFEKFSQESHASSMICHVARSYFSHVLGAQSTPWRASHVALWLLKAQGSQSNPKSHLTHKAQLSRPKTRLLSPKPKIRPIIGYYLARNTRPKRNLFYLLIINIGPIK